MLNRLTRLAIQAAARRDPENAGYMLALYDASPRVLRQLKAAVGMLSHREAVPVDAAYAAQFVGALAEGCGSCVQIHVDMALGGGVSEGQIEAMLKGDEAAVSRDVALAMRFARALVLRSSTEAELREEVRERWGHKGVIDLTMAVQTSRFLSMLKAGFGYATTCGTISVGERRVGPEREPA